MAEKVARLREEISAAAKSAGRTPSDVLLCAVCKTRDSETVRESALLPVDLFGENHAQELCAHLESGAYLGKPVHFIGHLQTNKVKKVVGSAAVIESADSAKLLLEINKEAEKRGATQDVLIEINAGREESKSGVFPEELFSLCEEAEKLGFTSLWLYDEFNWPSGSCAHRVPRENPDFAMRFVCAFREGEEIKVEVRRNPDYTDLMNPAATDRFIALTHERYYARLAPWFGKLIKGIFTDEPEIGYFGEAGRDALFCMGYYEGLERDYRELTGGDLFSDIAAGVRSDPDFYPAVCAKLLAGRFRASYIDRVQAWCEAHGVVLTGHLMNETSPFTARKSNGRILRVLSGMGLPGMF